MTVAVRVPTVAAVVRGLDDWVQFDYMAGDASVRVTVSVMGSSTVFQLRAEDVASLSRLALANVHG